MPNLPVLSNSSITLSLQNSIGGFSGYSPGTASWAIYVAGGSTNWSSSAGGPIGSPTAIQGISSGWQVTVTGGNPNAGTSTITVTVNAPRIVNSTWDWLATGHTNIRVFIQGYSGSTEYQYWGDYTLVAATVLSKTITAGVATTVTGIPLFNTQTFAPKSMPSQSWVISEGCCYDFVMWQGGQGGPLNGSGLSASDNGWIITGVSSGANSGASTISATITAPVSYSGWNWVGQNVRVYLQGDDTSHEYMYRIDLSVVAASSSPLPRPATVIQAEQIQEDGRFAVFGPRPTTVSLPPPSKLGFRAQVFSAMLEPFEGFIWTPRAPYITPPPIYPFRFKPQIFNAPDLTDEGHIQGYWRVFGPLPGEGVHTQPITIKPKIYLNYDESEGSVVITQTVLGNQYTKETDGKELAAGIAAIDLIGGGATARKFGSQLKIFIPAGFPQYIEGPPYHFGSLVIAEDYNVYRSLVSNNQGNPPLVDPGTQWEAFFIRYSTAINCARFISASDPVGLIGALNFVENAGIAGSALVTLNLPQGTYNYTTPIVVNHPQGEQIQIIGHGTTLNFTGNGFVVSTLGLIDHLTISGSATGTGLSCFAGEASLGTGVVINSFTTGVSAMATAYVDASNGVGMTNCTTGYYAANGGVIRVLTTGSTTGTTTLYNPNPPGTAGNGNGIITNI